MGRDRFGFADTEGKRRLRKGPPCPGERAHPSGRHPVFTRVVAHPCATWALSPGHGVLGDLRGGGFDRWGDCGSSASLSPFHDFCGVLYRCESRATIEATPSTRRKDAVLSPWGSSGTGMCRGRELRQGRRRERRPPWRQDGGSVRSRALRPATQAMRVNPPRIDSIRGRKRARHAGRAWLACRLDHGLDSPRKPEESR